MHFSFLDCEWPWSLFSQVRLAKPNLFYPWYFFWNFYKYDRTLSNLFPWETYSTRTLLLGWYLRLIYMLDKFNLSFFTCYFRLVSSSLTTYCIRTNFLFCQWSKQAVFIRVLIFIYVSVNTLLSCFEYIFVFILIFSFLIMNFVSSILYQML